jgi:molybdopterin molybdotransferase
MTVHTTTLPLLGFAAFSGTGKTTLLEQLLPMLTEAGLKVGMLKHAHHQFDIDQPGKDSYRLRKAGAAQMLIASRHRHAMMVETPEQEPSFEELLSQFDQQKLDLILVEGFKHLAFPKIELNRKELEKPWLHPDDATIIAVASDSAENLHPLPQFSINDIDAIAQFIVQYVNSYSD